jgi:hypothetical protein
MTLPDPSSPVPPAPPPGGHAPKLAKPQPKPRHGPRPPDAEGAVGSGSATGFVSMLAKRQFDADVLSATLADEAARRDRLHMAREVAAPAPAAPAPAPAVLPPAVPRWYRMARPVALVLAGLLLAIGLWAVGALFYMQLVAPHAARDVYYPLISWRLEAGPAGDYTRASRVMAWAMLLCLPVSALLVVLAKLLRERTEPRR